ncbi:MAG: hypothetical protein ACOX3K_04775 [Bacilli bacterium]|jgi:hypothetical protein
MNKKSTRNKKVRRPLTYAETHNRSLKIYQNTCSFITWAGLMNFFGAVFALFNRSGTTFYYLNFTFNQWIFRTLEFNGLSESSPVAFVVLVLVIAAVSGAGFVLLGQFARRGYHLPLMVGTAIYFVDLILLFFLPAHLEDPNFRRIGFIFHGLILMMMVISIIFYYHIVKLQKSKKAPAEEETFKE